VIQKEVIIDIKTSSNNIEVSKTIKGLFSYRMNDTQKLIGCCFGVFICYFYYGILQEKITRVPYGEDKEKFTFQQTLVFFQCVVNAFFAAILIRWTYENKKDTTPTYMYIWCSLSYMGAMLASNMSLRYVSYPTQVLGKSCKPIPVMILGVLLAKKSYPLIKYLCVLFIVLGCALFLYKDKKNVASEEAGTGYGEILLLVSLTLDGLTGASQDKMRSEYQTKAHQMMLAINLWSMLYLGVSIVATGEIFQFVTFCGNYPHVLWNMVLFALTSALGQHFIFSTVISFGPLTCSVVTTTRKFFTILFSILFFGNAITNRQTFAVFLVFTGLGLDAVFGKTQKKVTSKS